MRGQLGGCGGYVGEHSQESITVHAPSEMQMDRAQLESVWQVRKTGGTEHVEVVTEVAVLRQPTVCDRLFTDFSILLRSLHLV